MYLLKRLAQRTTYNCFIVTVVSIMFVIVFSARIGFSVHYTLSSSLGHSLLGKMKEP